MGVTEKICQVVLVDGFDTISGGCSDEQLLDPSYRNIFFQVTQHEPLVETWALALA